MSKNVRIVIISIVAAFIMCIVVVAVVVIVTLRFAPDSIGAFYIRDIIEAIAGHF